jgi:WD40 repeat protein
VRIWNGVTGKHLRTLDQHVGIVNDVAVRPRREVDPLPVIVSISEDRTVRLWQPTIGRLMRFARIPATPRSVIWSADGERVLVGCSDGRLRVIVAETAAVAGEYEGIPGRIHALAASRNDSHVLVAGETGVAHRLFDD